MLDALRDRREARLRAQAASEYERRQQLLRPGYKIWGYKNAFAKGFVATQGPSTYAPRQHWDHLTVGTWHLRLDPVLERQTARSEHAEVLAHVTLEREDADTRVDWTMKGEHDFMGKIMSLFFNMDKRIGRDFEKGLAQLKAVAER